MNEEYIRALVTFTRSTSEPTLDAVIEHICNGLSQKNAAVKYGVEQSAVARLTTRIKKLDTRIQEIATLKK
jgi:hypothetical protein